MANLNMEERLEKVRKAATDRRHSVLSTNTTQELEDVGSPWDIATTEHLQQWVEHKPDEVLEFMNNIRLERDQCMHVALKYMDVLAKKHEAEKDRDDALEMVSSLQEQLHDADQSAQDSKQQLKALQSKIKKPAKAPADDDQSEASAAEEETSRSSLKKRSSKKEKSTKFPDPPIFTDGVDPTWESWSYAIEEKLRINSDHYPLDEDKVAYIISRTGGKANKHTIVRKRKDALRPYRLFTDVLEHLASTFEDTNRLEIAKVEYNALRQNSSTFRVFFAEFMRLGSEVGKSDNDLKEDLRNKVNARLYDRLATSELSRGRGNLRDLKEFFMHYDDSGRTRALQEEAEKATKSKASTSTRKATTYVVPSRRSTTVTTETGAPNSQTKNTNVGDSGRGPCYNCGKPDHIARNCPDPPTEAGKSASKAAKAHAIEMDEEFDPQGLECSSDSGND